MKEKDIYWRQNSSVVIKDKFDILITVIF
jgi:hypothetical protein